MRDVNRIKPIMEKLEELWIENPDLRLAQLIMIVCKTEELNPKMFYLEDDIFVDRLMEFKNKLDKTKPIQ